MQIIRFSILLLISLGLCLTACQNEDAQNNTSNTASTSSSSTSSSTGGNPQENSTHHKASADAPLIGLWEYGVSIHPSKPKFKKENEGRWIRFNTDNTFTSGKYQDQNNTGTWVYKPNAQIIQLNFEDNSINDDLDWQIQMSSSQDQMIWKGNADYNTSGAQIKMVRTEELPQG